MNSWPGNTRHAMSQQEHEQWNANHYPGTRQLCCRCSDPTERCEEDSLYADDDREVGPLCETCYLDLTNQSREARTLGQPDGMTQAKAELETRGKR